MPTAIITPHAAPTRNEPEVTANPHIVAVAPNNTLPTY